jgi:flagellar motor switch protein FliN/FliY
LFDLNKDIKSNIEIFFTQETIVLEETIKKALNIDCFVKFTKAQITNKIEEGDFFGKYNLNINGVNLGLYVSMNAKLASIISDLMLMGPGQAKDILDPDDIDSLKELFSQIFGAYAQVIRENGYKVSFDGFSSEKPQDGSFFESEFEIIIKNITESSLYQYINIDEFKKVLDSLKIEISQSQDTKNTAPIFEIADESKHNQVQETSKDNLNLLMDIELNARVRIGSKQMLLKDIVKLSEGTIIDLDKNVDEPMEILVNGKTIAKGIVVVVGGNFGIKITHVGTKEDRIKSLGG